MTAQTARHLDGHRLKIFRAVASCYDLFGYRLIRGLGTHRDGSMS